MNEFEQITGIKLPVDLMTEEEIEQARAKERAELRHLELNVIVPAFCQVTEQSRLPSKELAQALTWATHPTKQPLNLLLSGTTGTGKTRIAWEAIKTRYLNTGTKPMAIGAESFVRRILRESELMEKLIFQKLLLVDDLGKERTTPTAESAIFELIRERMDNLLPTIYTTNFSPTTLAARFGQRETGEAVCRRIKEDSTCIKLI